MSKPYILPRLVGIRQLSDEGVFVKMLMVLVGIATSLCALDSMLWAANPDLQQEASTNYFVNPFAEGADPSIVQHDGDYLFCLSDGNRGVAIHRSSSLVQLGPGRSVWTAPSEGPVSRQVWAPELLSIDGRWYIYFAASDGDNENHRTYVLESEDEDPFGPYQLHGPLYTGDTPADPETNRWAIDATVLESGGELYLVWSGWETEIDEQWLYIAKMTSPTKVAEPRIRIANNDDYLWERVDENLEGRGLHEAPQVLRNGEKTFIVYSCSGSWQPSYKLGLLELKTGSNPLIPDSWVKHPHPVFAPHEKTFGAGHPTFTTSPDGTEKWIVYHAKRTRRPGWLRALHAQPFHWGPDNLPQFGVPVSPGVPLRKPTGTPETIEGPQSLTIDRFDAADCDEDWAYYGHQQACTISDGKIRLGTSPAGPVNYYRGGEKALLRRLVWHDVQVEATIQASDKTVAGVLFRANFPSVGQHAYRGYFAGFDAEQGKIILGASDGETWRLIASTATDADPDSQHVLTVQAEGDLIRIMIDGKPALDARDNSYPRGSVGLRVDRGEASFSRFTIRAN